MPRRTSVSRAVVLAVVVGTFVAVTPAQAVARAEAPTRTVAAVQQAAAPPLGASCGTNGIPLADGSGCRFTTVGTDTFKAPYYQPNVTFTLYGAGLAGAGDPIRDGFPQPTINFNRPDWGGMTQGTLAVTRGATYQINVGGTQETLTFPWGGFNGGGDGGPASSARREPRSFGSCCSVGGSGASDVRSGGYGLLDRLFVAGGAGGFARPEPDAQAGNDRFAYGGPGGGATGGTGGAGAGLLDGSPGTGGSQSAAGASPGDAGSAGRGFGGTGGSILEVDGAGGGGGYFGGGASGSKSTTGSGLPGGGGGGSGYITPLATATASKVGGQRDFYLDESTRPPLDERGRGLVIASWPGGQPTAAVSVTSSHTGTVDPNAFVTLTTKVTTSTGVAPEGSVKFVDYTRANGSTNPSAPQHCPCYNITGDLLDHTQDGTYVKRVRAGSLAGGPGHTIVAIFEDSHGELATVRSAPVSFRTPATPVDLGLTLTDAPDPITVGDDIVYTLGVTNHSATAATAVRPYLFVENVSGNDVTFKQAGTSSICRESGGAVLCDFDGVATGATETATVVMTAHKAGQQRATASFPETAEPDPNPANDSAEVTTQVDPSAGPPPVPRAGLSVYMTAPTRVTVGEDIAYRVAVHNNGPARATGVVTTNVLPVGVTFKAAGTSSYCTSSSRSVSCDVGDLGVGEQRTAVLVVTADELGSVANTATVVGNEIDPAPADNSSTATTQVTEPLPAADLAIDVSAPDRSTYSADTVYRIAVTNHGPNTATRVKATDVLPANVRFKAAGTSASCVATFQQTVVTCDFGDVAVGATEDAQIVVLPDTEWLSNTVTVTGEGPDPVSSNNSSTARTRVQDQYSPADLAITTTAPEQVVVGDDITYGIVMTNDGPVHGFRIQTTTPLPEGVTFKSAGTSERCTHTSGTVTCDLGQLAPDGTATVDVVVTANRSGAFSTTTTVEGGGVDPDRTNDSSTATTQVVVPGTVGFSVGDYVVDEGGTARVTVERTGGSDGPVSVDFATTGAGTAGSDDFTAVEGTLNFTDGQTSAWFTVATIQDTRFEPDETVSVELSDPRGGADLARSAATVTIVNDDVDPTPTPTPTPTPDPSPTPVPTPTPTSGPTSTPTSTSTPSPTPSPTPEPDSRACTVGDPDATSDQTLRGTDRADVICGGSGNDTIRGLGGDDVILGGGGDDTVFGGSGDDRIVGADGDDDLRGGRGSDTLVGGAGDDRLGGGGGDDVILGGDGQDTILGGSGDDRLVGGAGNDDVRGWSGDDVITGGGGSDDLGGGAGHDRVLGGAGNDEIRGGAGTNHLVGGAGEDTVDGVLDVARRARPRALVSS